MFSQYENGLPGYPDPIFFTLFRTKFMNFKKYRIEVNELR